MTDPMATAATTSMRVVTWNMDHWRRTLLQQEAAWERLRSLVAPSVALLQESVPARDLDRSRVIYREIGRGRRWGSAIVALDDSVELEEIWSVQTRYSRQTFTLHNTYPGSVAVARVRLPGVAPVTVISLYTVTDVYAQTTLLRVIADLIPLFDSVDGQRVILAGDLNVGTDPRDNLTRTRGEGIIHALESLGLVNLYSHVGDRPERPEACGCGQAGCEHLTTRAGGGQFDHFYASPEIARQCVRIVRFDDPDTQALSDHWPIAADFELTAAPTKHEWNVETFAEEMGARHGAEIGRAIREIGIWAEQKELSLHTQGHRRWTMRCAIPAAIEPEMWVQMDYDSVMGVQYTISIRAHGDVVVQFQYIKRPPFNDSERKEQLRARLNAIDGVLLERVTGRPTFGIDVLADPGRLRQVLDVLEWVVDETVAADALADLAADPDPLSASDAVTG